MLPLSGRQRAVLDAIAAATAAHGYPPSLREVGAVVGLSPSTVLHHVRILESRGYVRREHHSIRCQPRTLAVVPPEAEG